MTQFIKIKTALSPATVALIKTVIADAHAGIDPIKIILTASQAKG